MHGYYTVQHPLPFQFIILGIFSQRLGWNKNIFISKVSKILKGCSLSIPLPNVIIYLLWCIRFLVSIAEEESMSVVMLKCIK